MIGAPELLIVLAIVVVLFGATRIAGIGKGIGRGIREFRSELRNATQEQPKTDASSVNTPVSKPQDIRSH